MTLRDTFAQSLVCDVCRRKLEFVVDDSNPDLLIIRVVSCPAECKAGDDDDDDDDDWGDDDDDDWGDDKAEAGP